MNMKSKPTKTAKPLKKEVEAHKVELTLASVIENIKALSFEDRKTLASVVSQAHSKDLEKLGGGAEPDGEGYHL